MTAVFSRMDQRLGGGHARTAVAQYLNTDVGGYLRGRFSDDHVRRGMFSAASELAGRRAAPGGHWGPPVG